VQLNRQRSAALPPCVSCVASSLHTDVRLPFPCFCTRPRQVGFCCLGHFTNVYDDDDDDDDDDAGGDGSGWSMYIDNARSWFVHAGVHTARADGGVSTGSVVGVLLDVDRRQLSFYVDGEPHGPPATVAAPVPGGGRLDAAAVMTLPPAAAGARYFPAVSINRNVQLTVQSGLPPPVLDSDSDDSQ